MNRARPSSFMSLFRSAMFIAFKRQRRASTLSLFCPEYSPSQDRLTRMYLPSASLNVWLAV